MIKLFLYKKTEESSESLDLKGDKKIFKEETTPL